MMESAEVFYGQATDIYRPKSSGVSKLRAASYGQTGLLETHSSKLAAVPHWNLDEKNWRCSFFSFPFLSTP